MFWALVGLGWVHCFGSLCMPQSRPGLSLPQFLACCNTSVPNPCLQPHKCPHSPAFSGPFSSPLPVLPHRCLSASLPALRRRSTDTATSRRCCCCRCVRWKGGRGRRKGTSCELCCRLGIGWHGVLGRHAVQSPVEGVAPVSRLRVAAAISDCNMSASPSDGRLHAHRVLNAGLAPRLLACPLRADGGRLHALLPRRHEAAW